MHRQKRKASIVASQKIAASGTRGTSGWKRKQPKTTTTWYRRHPQKSEPTIEERKRDICLKWLGNSRAVESERTMARNLTETLEMEQFYQDFRLQCREICEEKQSEITLDEMAIWLLYTVVQDEVEELFAQSLPRRLFLDTDTELTKLCHTKRMTQPSKHPMRNHCHPDLYQIDSLWPLDQQDQWEWLDWATFLSEQSLPMDLIRLIVEYYPVLCVEDQEQ
jgi:hypothetical protein